jgi:GNAT superfamily N-acetyltransferase
MRKDPASSGSSSGPGTLAARSFADAGIEAAVEALNRGFADYIVPMRWTPDALQRRMEAESVDGAASFIYRARNAPAAGVCMMARRGRASRVAAFCVSPEARKAGLGRRMLADALACARERGDVRTTLEVIEQNAGAVAFYRALGFTDFRRLYGYRRAEHAIAAGTPGDSAAALRDIPIAELADIAARYETEQAQWQLAAATLRALRAPARAYALQDHAYALVSGVRDDGFDLRALIVPPPKQRAGWGSRMIDALAARHPGKACNVAPIVPEGLVDAFFEATGFIRQSINQVELGVTL